MLAQLPCLQNLTLKACPVADQQGYQDSVISLLPQLHILDSHRVCNAVTQAKQQIQNRGAKQPSTQRPALQPQEKLLLSSRIDRTDRSHQPATKRSTQAKKIAAELPRLQQPVSGDTDEAPAIASRPVSKRKQREQLDDPDTADGNAGHGLSYVSSGPQEGKKDKQAISIGKGVQGLAANRRADPVSTIARELGKKKLRRDVTAAATGVQFRKDSIRKEKVTQHTLSMDDTSKLRTGMKTPLGSSMLAVKAAKPQPSKKSREHKSDASAPVPGKAQAQVSRKAQGASRPLASGKEVILPRSKLPQREMSVFWLFCVLCQV